MRQYDGCLLMWEKEHAAHSDRVYFSRCKVAFKDFCFIAAWPGLCKLPCFKVQIKAIDCSYFHRRVKERFCHEPPTLHFWAGRHDCGPMFRTGGRPWLFGEILELLVRPDRKASEQMAFTADWIGSLFRWQSSLIVGESFFFFLFCEYLTEETTRHIDIDTEQGEMEFYLARN